MDIKTFVSETLVQIMEGTREAVDRLAKIDGPTGVISPIFGPSMDAVNDSHVQKAEFDIAVTTTNKTDQGGKGGIKVMSLEIGGHSSTASENISVSRIKFSIPFIPSSTNVKPSDAS